MNDIIRQLPDSVANQIAAGEVIQRPASVVKELVENAVDAGATEIQIVIKDSGRTLIQVIDNGKGMTPTDARLAFERHATSKIRTAADLQKLHTMGFRGEALPSICAIAQVELRTMPADAEVGTKILISGSKVESQESEVCSKGSNFMVKNLFFNTPARRKFLKSDNAELGAIMREFERLALVNIGIRFKFTAGNKQYDFRPGTFKQRIADIWKNNLNMQLIPVEVETSVVKISGFISPPEFARRHNALQYFIVNGRNMEHKPFRRLVIDCYQGLIPVDALPCFFIRFEVDPDTIDVNVSPTKSEIKFEHEKIIYPIFKSAVTAALGRFSTAPSIDFSQEIMPFTPARKGDFVEKPRVEVDTSYRPYGGTGKTSWSGAPRKPSAERTQNWDRLYDGFMTRHQVTPARDVQLHDTLPQADDMAEDMQPDVDVSSICIQLADKYIVTPSAQGLLIVDQYRAHVKILYERYMRKASTAETETVAQREMFPETLSLSPEQHAIMTNIAPDLFKLGFVMRHLGDNKWSMDAVPVVSRRKNVKEVVLKILEMEAQDSDMSSLPGMGLQKVALAAARAAAITGGTHLGSADMERIVSDLFSLPDPLYTPDHKLIMKTIPIDYIKGLLK